MAGGGGWFVCVVGRKTRRGTGERGSDVRVLEKGDLSGDPCGATGESREDLGEDLLHRVRNGIHPGVLY